MTAPRLLPLAPLFLIVACCTSPTSLPASAGETSAGTRAVSPPDPTTMRFGVNGGAYPSVDAGEERMKAVTRDLDELGLVWLRHPGRGSAWFEVQPHRDRWDFRKLDAVMAGNAHPWLLEVYGQVGTVYPFHPDFSPLEMRQKKGTEEVMRYLRERSVDLQDEAQRADAEAYTRTLVQRYGDRVTYWEIGNEGMESSNRFDLIQHTYTWIKDAQPGATVVITGLAGDDERMYRQNLDALDRLLAQGAGAYFDVGNIHWYGKAGGTFEADLERRYTDYADLLDRHGLRKPIWVTETSTSSASSSVVSGPSSEALQARHVVIRLVVFAAMGAEKVFWHGYRETFAHNKFHECNLRDSATGDPKPAHTTLALLVDKIGHFESVETIRHDRVHLYRFTNPGGAWVLVGWTQSPGAMDLSEHVGGSRVTVTHIVEARGEEPRLEQYDATAVQLSESPVFVE